MNYKQKIIEVQELEIQLKEHLTKFGIFFHEQDLALHCKIAEFLQYRLAPNRSLIQVTHDYIESNLLQEAINATIKPATKGGETLSFLNPHGNLVELPKTQFFRILETQLGNIITFEAHDAIEDAKQIWSALVNEYCDFLSVNEGKPFPMDLSEKNICLNSEEQPIYVINALYALPKTSFQLDEFCQKLNITDLEVGRSILRYLTRHNVIVWNKKEKIYEITRLGQNCLVEQTLNMKPFTSPIFKITRKKDDPIIIKTLFSNFMEQIETIFYDHMTLHRSARLIKFDIDLDLSETHLSFDHVTESATIHMPLLAPVAPHPVKDEATVQLAVKDFEDHFKSSQKSEKPTEFQDLLRFLLACRMAGSRKKAYLWLWCFSDWGKGFLFGSVLKNLGIVCEMTTGDIIKAYEGGNVGVDAHDLKHHWILWVDEFRSNSNAIKLLDQSFTATPKYALRFSSPTYAKVFTSATDVKSLSGAGSGVEEQMVNRFSLLDVAREDLTESERADLRLGNRPIVQKMTDVVYRQAIETYVAEFLKNHLAAYAALPQVERYRTAADEMAEWHAKHQLADPEDAQGLTDSVERIAELIKTSIRDAQNRFIDNQLKASKEKDLENSFWSLPFAIQGIIGSIRPVSVKGQEAFFLSKPEAEKIVDAFIQLEHHSFRATIALRSTAIIRAMHDVNLCPFDKQTIPRPYVYGEQKRGIAFLPK